MCKDFVNLKKFSFYLALSLSFTGSCVWLWKQQHSEDTWPLEIKQKVDIRYVIAGTLFACVLSS